MTLRSLLSSFRGAVGLGAFAALPQPTRPVTTVAASCVADGWTEWSDGSRTVIPKIACDGWCAAHGPVGRERAV